MTDQPARRRGRQQFDRFRPLLRFGASVCRWLPAWLLRALWSLLDGFHGALGSGLRYMIVKARAKACGDNVLVGPHVVVHNFEQLELGNNVSVHRGCQLFAAGGLKIGNDVSIAHLCSILTADHGWEDESLPIRDNRSHFAPVEIADDVWLGCHVVVLAGVRIGSRTIIAAGAVVTKDVPPGSLAGGVPAKVIRPITGEEGRG